MNRRRLAGFLLGLVLIGALVVYLTSSRGEGVKVTHIVDGDTFDVVLASGETERIRPIGIDTPETVDPRKGEQCFGQEATQRAHELLDGIEVRLESDPSKHDRDKYDRLLRYVWLPDGRLFERVMLEEGFAKQKNYGEHYDYEADFIDAERSARENGRGLWDPATCNGNSYP